MKALLAAGLGLLPGIAIAAQDVDETLAADPEGRVTVSNIAGMVDIRGWSRNEVRVTGELGDRVDELKFERDGDHVEIIVKVKRNSGRGDSTDLDIRVPEASSIKVGTVSADIEVADVKGAQNLHTVSGDVDSEAYAADVEVESVSGDIVVQGDGDETDIELNAVSGDIEVQNVAGHADMVSVSGDLVLVNSVLKRVGLNTTNGDIVFNAQLVDDGRLDIETINGEVDVEFEGSVSARFDIETFNGDIDSCFGPEPVRTSKYTPGLELSFSEGGGSGRVDIKTLNGDVRLCRD